MDRVTIYLSYCSEDAAFVDRLAADLRAAGATIRDHEDRRQAQALDWQASIRQGIEAASTVIYIGSPDAAQSLACRAEVVIASEEHRTIIPIWVRGDQWSQCAPFLLVGANYLDARGAMYLPTLDRIRDTLNLRARPLGASSAAPKPAPSMRISLRLDIENAGVHSALAWSPDSARLAGVDADGVVRLWDAVTGRLVSTLGSPAQITRYLGRGLAWNRQGSRIAACEWTGSICVWDVDTGQMVCSLVGSEKITRISWAPDGQRLASSSERGDIRLWDMVTEQQLMTLVGDKQAATSVTWSPDSSRLASGTRGMIHLWDAHSGLLLDALTIEALEPVRCVTWSPAGFWIAACAENKLLIWDVNAGRLLQALEADSTRVLDVAWAPDGVRLATSGMDALTRVWDAASGRLLAMLEAPGPRCQGVAWAPDGTGLALASNQGAIRIWNIVDEHDTSGDSHQHKSAFPRWWKANH